VVAFVRDSSELSKNASNEQTLRNFLNAIVEYAARLVRL
jgi:hypothetical protein